MKLYYYYNGILLEVYDKKKNKILEIPCVVGENLLLVIEDYLSKNELDIKFNELIPI